MDLQGAFRPDPVLLEMDQPDISPYLGRYFTIGHREHVFPYTEPIAEHPGGVGEPHPVPEHLPACDMHGTVIVPDTDELINAEALRLVMRGK